MGIEKNGTPEKDAAGKNIAEILNNSGGKSILSNDPEILFSVARYYAADDNADKNLVTAFDYYRRAAEMGHADAQYELGRSFEEGCGTRKDCAKAIVWYRKAAEQGCAEAMCSLGDCFRLGKGIEADAEEASGWYTRASGKGCTRADRQIAIWAEERGTRKRIAGENASMRSFLENRAKSRKIGLFAAAMFVVISVFVSFAYWHIAACGGRDSSEAPAQAKAHTVTESESCAESYRKAAEQGDAKAQFELGRCYEKGLGVSTDYNAAADWYRRAADKTNAEAMAALGRCYENGLGVDLDRSEALKWYRRSADLGCWDGINGVGKFYCIGIGVEKNYAEAAEWYRKAADAGNSEAQVELGHLYEADRFSLPGDSAEALKWYRKAAESGNLEGKKNLARFYEYGMGGLTKDEHKAFTLYHECAEKDERYCIELGRCCEFGIGTEKNYAEAEIWYSKSAAKGNLFAEGCLQSVREKQRRH